MMSDDEEQQNLTPIFGNIEQYTPFIPQRWSHTIQLCQRMQSVADTPESRNSKNQAQKDSFRPYNLPKSSTAASSDNLLSILAVAEG